MQVMEVRINKTIIESTGHSAKLTQEFEFENHEDLSAFMQAMHTWFKSVTAKNDDNDKSSTGHLCC